MFHRVSRAIAKYPTAVRGVHVEAKIAALGLKLPSPAIPKGSFVNFLIVDNFVYLSGHLPQVSYFIPILLQHFLEVRFSCGSFTSYFFLWIV